MYVCAHQSIIQAITTLYMRTYIKQGPNGKHMECMCDLFIEVSSSDFTQM